MIFYFLCLYLFLWQLKSHCKNSWFIWHKREQHLTLKLWARVFVFKASFSTFLLTTLSYTGSGHGWFHLLHHLDSHPARHLLKSVSEWELQVLKLNFWLWAPMSKGQLLPLLSLEYFIKFTSLPVYNGCS